MRDRPPSINHDAEQRLLNIAVRFESRDARTLFQSQFLDAFHSVQSSRRNGIPYLWLHHDLENLAKAFDAMECVSTASVFREMKTAIDDSPDDSQGIESRFAQRFREVTARDLASLAHRALEAPELFG